MLATISFARGLPSRSFTNESVAIKASWSIILTLLCRMHFKKKVSDCSDSWSMDKELSPEIRTNCCGIDTSEKYSLSFVRGDRLFKMPVRIRSFNRHAALWIIQFL